LGRVDAFIPVLQTALSIADLITAALLFGQYSIQPQQALLAVASGYVFSGSFAFLHGPDCKPRLHVDVISLEDPEQSLLQASLRQ
jgi:hypothetical protein